MGTGGLIQNCKGEWLLGFSSKDGIGDAVLFAELFGIFHGLTLLGQLDYRNIICETDFEETVILLQQRATHAFHAYGGLLTKITNMMDSLPGLQLQHAYRESNRCADYMAKLGRSKEERRER